MDVIGFLCVSLGSSTVQGVAEEHEHFQRLDVLPKSSVLLCVFLWTEGLNAKNIHKEIFPVYGGKCLSRKAVHNWVEKFSQGS
jgi:hypothetical protein